MNENLPNCRLAVVIPAFKGDFLAKTLESVVRQTNQRFNLYIFDDASLVDIRSIARSVRKSRPYVYERFEDNMGGISMAKHWNRCTSGIKEPWIWLFSDDDVMEPSCVEAFHSFLETEGDITDLLRYDGCIIDQDDNICGLAPVNVDDESWLEFAYGLLMGFRGSFMQQLVFRRQALEEVGGFLDFPLGWCADGAAIIQIAKRKRLKRISGARMYWRASGKNLTFSTGLKMRREKLRACCLFIDWLQAELQGPRETLFAGDRAVFARVMDRWLVRQIGIIGGLPALCNWGLLSKTRREACESKHASLVKYVAAATLHDGMSFFSKLVRPGSSVSF